jgi:hypothetical protein
VRPLPAAALLLALALYPGTAGAQVPPSDTDKDGDGWTKQAGDCKDDDPSIYPGAPERCNDKDDDCDGARDEGCVGSGDCDREGEACSTGQLGECAAGRIVCEDGAPVCRRVNDPTAERCDNGRDDDCDGDVDGRDSDCSGGGGSGRCADGDADGWAVCSGSCELSAGDRCGDCNDADGRVNPGEAERCNGRDDTCDGRIDEGNPGGGLGCNTGSAGLCAAGVQQCVAGGLVCSPVNQPKTESCSNGEDDDCDGLTDSKDPSCDPDCAGRLDTDTDGDRQPDCADNCPSVSNSKQEDFDLDGMGDACETGAKLCDVDRSGRVDGRDLAALARAFAASCGQSRYRKDADLDRDCTIDGQDLALLGASFGVASR